MTTPAGDLADTQASTSEVRWDDVVTEVVATPFEEIPGSPPVVPADDTFEELGT